MHKTLFTKLDKLTCTNQLQNSAVVIKIEMADGRTIELPGSELGTREYWEQSYGREIQNYKNHGDVGEIWFDEDSQMRVINWMLKNASVTEQHRIVDLGCGNGMFLVELAREGFKQLVGIDYSPNGVNLAKNIAEDQKLDIKYFVKDLLSSADLEDLGLFDILHDKGTYDAVSIHPDKPKEKRDQYLENIHKMLKPDGLFIITSCNWTEDELVASFSGKFQKFYSIPTPTFKFGGKIGNVVTSVVFNKV